MQSPSDYFRLRLNHIIWYETDVEFLESNYFILVFFKYFFGILDSSSHLKDYIKIQII